MKYTAVLFATLFVHPLVASAESSAGDACKLLTQEDVASVVGAGYDTAPRIVTKELCVYRKSAADFAGLIVLEAPGGAAKALRENGAYMARTQKVNAVEGLGEGAFWVVASNKMGLHFGKGTRRVVLEVYAGNKPDVTTAQKLAKLTLARL